MRWVSQQRGQEGPTPEPFTTPIGWRSKAVVVCFFVLMVAWSLIPPTPSAGENSRRAACKNNLKWIGVALKNYHDTYGSFPPPYIADRKGRPIHSWRILLAPYMDHQEIYDDYRFDEPWDGPNNRIHALTRFLQYLCHSDANSYPREGIVQTTSYLAVIGPGTVWDPERPCKLSDIKDDLSTTILVVEVASSGIPWMEPRDLHIDQMNHRINGNAGPGISSVHKKGANALFADGSVRWLSDKLPPETLRAMLTINGGEKIPEF